VVGSHRNICVWDWILSRIRGRYLCGSITLWNGGDYSVNFGYVRVSTTEQNADAKTYGEFVMMAKK
jgi:hypothetical protein